MITIPLIEKITELFLILFATAALVKLNVLQADYSKVLSRVSLYFVTPCVIFNSFQIEVTEQIKQNLIISIILATVFEMLFFLLAAVLRRCWKATEVEWASIVFPNAGNLIIPLVSYVMGQEYVVYVSGYIMVFNILCWTIGIRMFDQSSSPDLRKIFLNPNILAIFCGLLFFFTGLPLPKTVSIAFSDVASMIGPLSMMITGFAVGSMKFRDMFANHRIYAVIFFRMLLCPAFAVALAIILGNYGILAGRKVIILISLLSAIAPSANNINQLAILYNRDVKYASAISILTTLVCIITIPMWVQVYESFVR